MRDVLMTFTCEPKCCIQAVSKIRAAANLIVSILFLFAAICRLAAQPGNQAKSDNLFFRPLPSGSIEQSSDVILLDGVWRINPKPLQDFQSANITGTDWSDL